MEFKKLATLSLAASMALFPMVGEAAVSDQLEAPEKSNVVNVSDEAGKYVKVEVIVKFKDKAAKSAQSSTLSKIGAKEVADDDAVKSDFKVLKAG
ncbi:S8 family serine peptidase [Pseudalkalibacillus sp. A8]|uniref:S8 family serine peptidase n=1 Tax=Pseudalkalibacillus sp. A8 TaxID=3382641 RepID=UPI0038B5B661